MLLPHTGGYRIERVRHAPPGGAGLNWQYARDIAASLRVSVEKVEAFFKDRNAAWTWASPHRDNLYRSGMIYRSDVAEPLVSYEYPGPTVAIGKLPGQMNQRWWTSQAIATEWGVSTTTVRRWFENNPRGVYLAAHGAYLYQIDLIMVAKKGT